MGSQRLAKQLELTAAWRIESGQQSQQGRLAGATLAEDRHRFPGEHRKRKITQNGQRPIATPDLLAEMASL